MTPEEHYGWGEGLLKGAKEHPADDPAGAQTLAVIAQAHFAAASSGTAMRALEAMTHPVQSTAADEGLKPGDMVAYLLRQPDAEPRRIHGTVVGVATDGFATAEFPQDAPTPMTVIAPVEAFIRIRETRGGDPA